MKISAAVFVQLQNKEQVETDSTANVCFAVYACTCLWQRKCIYCEGNIKQHDMRLIPPKRI